MSRPIDAILFDMGGTLSYEIKQEESGKLKLVAQIQELVGSNTPLAEFIDLLANRARAYKLWSKTTLVELDERRIWLEWMLPDYPSSQVTPLAPRLNQLWRQANRIMQAVPEARDTLLELFRRGYRLGLVSNTTSGTEGPVIIDSLEISGIFETMLLSCQFGKRKPDPGMLLAAAKQMEIAPERCAYVGDRPDRDVAAARQAGFGQAIIIRQGQARPNLQRDAPFPPDHLITNLAQLLDLFPRRVKAGGLQRGSKKIAPESTSTVWNASLSTMWAIHNFPRLGDFYQAARRLGFYSIELNHQVSPDMLDGVKSNGLHFSSIHEPCPAGISADTLKKRDWLISATDEECRLQGIWAVKRSIDLAKALGAGTVVIHAGNVHLDYRLEKQLGALLAAGAAATDEYQEIKARLVDCGQALLRPRLEATKKSLRALLDYAAPMGIRLGLENRYHLSDLPGIDELAELLDLAEPERLGFVFDTGHARAQENLGFARYEEWLTRYGTRLFGTHLHDVNGTVDHDVPGTGEIDFALVGAYLPPDAFRTLELRPSTSAVQIREGLKHLYLKGCVTCLKPQN